MQAAISWLPVVGTPDYVSSDGRFYATYKRTERGHAVYWTHPSTIKPKARRMMNAESVGGIPGH